MVVSGRAVEIGRHPNCTVRLAEPTVGQRHLTLRRRGQAYVMSDEGGRNGTLVVARGESEGVLLGPNAPRIVQDRDRVHLGHVAIEFRTEPPFFEGDEVELLPDAAAVPEQSVRAALAGLGVVASEAELEEAVRTLLGAPEELMGPERIRAAEPDVPNQSARDAVLRDPTPLDWIISMCAIGVLGGAGVALYQLITRH